MLQCRSLMGSQVSCQQISSTIGCYLVCRSCHESAPAQASHEVISFFRHPPSPLWIPPCCRWISAPPWTSMSCSDTAASPWSSLWAAEESALAPGALPSPLSLTLMSAELFLSHIITALSGCSCTVVFPPSQIHDPRGATTTADGLAQSSDGSILELSGIYSIGHMGKASGSLSQKPPCSPPLVKPCHTNTVQSQKEQKPQNGFRLFKLPNNTP